MRKFHDVPGGQLSAVHFGDATAPLDMVFLHATGFNALAYTALLSPLAAETGVHIAAIDMRGHGMSTLPADPETLENWHSLRDDICAFLDQYADKPVVIAGHSCGAVVSFLVAEKMPKAIRGLVSFDPVSMPTLSRLIFASRWGRERAKKKFPLARNAGKRRAVFDSFDAVFERYQGRGTFKGVADETLRDYIKGGFRKTETGVELTCAPSWEQAIFVAQGHNIYAAAKYAPSYRKVIYAGKFSPSWPATRAKMARIIGKDNVELHKQRAHFFPLQDTVFARDYLRKALKA